MSPWLTTSLFHRIIAFRSLPVRPNEWINRIASGSFMVYLIHEAPMLRHFWWVKIFHCELWGATGWYVPCTLGVVCIFFALGVAAEAACRWLERWIFRFPAMARLSLWMDHLLQPVSCSDS